jgi:hypothetical protein
MKAKITIETEGDHSQAELFAYLGFCLYEEGDIDIDNPFLNDKAEITLIKPIE